MGLNGRLYTESSRAFRRLEKWSLLVEKRGGSIRYEHGQHQGQPKTIEDLRRTLRKLLKRV